MLGIFSWLAGQTPDPPTSRQLAYAKRLGITVPPNATKQQVSDLISDYQRRHPQEMAQRKKAGQKIREQKFGPELVAQEKYWDDLSCARAAILAAYRKKDDVIVDVLSVEEPEIKETKTKAILRLRFVAPRKKREAGIGDVLDWDDARGFWLPSEKLLWHEVLEREFPCFFELSDRHRVRWYQDAVKRGISHAQNNRLGG